MTLLEGRDPVFDMKVSGFLLGSRLRGDDNIKKQVMQSQFSSIVVLIEHDNLNIFFNESRSFDLATIKQFQEIDKREI